MHRELQRAAAAGIIERDASRRPHRFQAATESPIYRPLRTLLELTVGVEPQLRQVVGDDAEIEAALVHGSWARGDASARSDIDLLVVGRPDITRLRRSLRKIERTLGRRIDSTVLTPDEFRARRSSGDAFLQKALAEPNLVLTGDFGESPR